jgi:hypothetical protein
MNTLISDMKLKNSFGQDCQMARYGLQAMEDISWVNEIIFWGTH